jgi:hypothetical protein
MLDEFLEVISARYDDTEEFLEGHKIDVLELFETGSAIFLLDNAYAVKLEVTKL